MEVKQNQNIQNQNIQNQNIQNQNIQNQRKQKDETENIVKETKINYNMYIIINTKNYKYKIYHYDNFRQQGSI